MCLIVNGTLTAGRITLPQPEIEKAWPTDSVCLPRGYFAIGAERISKALNLGNLMRSAHGFGASFTFTIGATYQALEARADTSKGAQHLPHYDWPSVQEMALPVGMPAGRH